MLTSFIGTFINLPSSAAQAIGAGGIFLIIVQVQQQFLDFNWIETDFVRP